MAGRIPRATHAGPLKIADMVIPCAVLEDGRRVLTQEGFLQAIGRNPNPKGGGNQPDGTPVFLTAKSLQPYTSAHLPGPTDPIRFRPLHGGPPASGYLAEMLPAVCKIFLDARDAKALNNMQLHIAERCDILLRGFAAVGIVALVDEATGYQKDRKANELAQLLEAYVNPVLRPWMKTFPDEYYQQIFRLQQWPYDQWSSNRPGYVGHLTNKLIYERLPPGVLGELKQKNPSLRGRRRYRLFQFLTADVGNPHLREHLILVIGLMKAAEDWGQFLVFFTRNFGVPGDQLRFDLTYRDAAFGKMPPDGQ